jgi:dTDP-glucose 4,6-dehydratase
VSKIICVTGYLGFIGRYVAKKLIERGDRVFGVDAHTYAADAAELFLEDDDTIKHVRADICDLDHLPNVDAIINLAAETHVDNSIMDNAKFYRSNVEGVRNLLELCRAKRNYEIPLFVQISTDEVYGDAEEHHGPTNEYAKLNPSSPYAASKAAADLMVQAWGRSYGIPYRIIRPSNCYGVGQYPEKLIPKAIRHLKLGRPIPVHESGLAERSWLNVEDAVRAILTVLDKGVNGGIYNIPGNTTTSVLKVVKEIVHNYYGTVDLNPMDFIQQGYVRVGIDRRYCVGGDNLFALGWAANSDLFIDLPSIVEAERSAFRW